MLGVFVVVSALLLPTPPLVRRPSAVPGRAAVRCADDDIDDADMDRLRSRIAKIQEQGGALATPSEKYFEKAMSKPPQELMADFFRTGNPAVVQAMTEATASLLGALPPFEFDTQVTTTGDKLAALMMQLQMTGYMLRNAEYVMTLRKVLKLDSRSAAEYRTAFEKLDLDESGFIEVGEVEQLLASVYGDEQVPSFEVTALMQLFDTDGDGRISWEEFAAALGAADAADSPAVGLLPLLGGSEDGEPSPSPEVGGTVTVTLDDGSEVEMDAVAYIAELKDEAQALRAELVEAAAAEQQKQMVTASSISAYVSSLPEEQLKSLTGGISADVSTAMRQIVTYILRAPGGDDPLDRDAEVTMEQQKLQQLCLYQLILGYTLREAEASGEASDAVGR